MNVRNSKPDNQAFYEKYYTAVHHVLGLYENSDVNGYANSKFALIHFIPSRATQEGLNTINQHTQQSLANNEVVRESSSTAYLSKGICCIIVLHSL